MPIISPTPGDVHVNGTLTNVSLAYMQNTAGFVADKVFPGVPVAKQSDIYWVWPRDAWNRDEMKVRAPGAQTAGTNFTVAQAPYYAEVKGLHHPIPDQVIANADSPIMYDAAATNLVTRKAMINRENGWIGKFFSAGVWTLQATGNATATAAGIVNAAKEGLTESNAFFGGKHALLSYSPATPSLMEPSAGYTFNWTGYLGATQNGTRIKRFYMVAEASTWVEVETAYDQRLTSAEMAFFFYNIIQ
jgi:hypothetical protein